jgi:biopolymer transport protein ExbD
MRINVPKRKRSDINMLPLMDSMFLLLVFFIYAMMSMVEQQGISMTLPKAATHFLTEREYYTISIDENSQLFFQKKPVTKIILYDTLKEIQSQYQEPAFIIHADTTTPHGAVVGVLDMLRELNIESVSFETQPL